MREVRLIAVSTDGAHLVLAGHDDEQLALRVDDRLHAAIRGDRARLGQLDIQLESQLRPRDIQARIRAGESLDAVAAVAGMPREKVERFAGPVIAEREHVVQRARQATVRRLGGDGPPQTLESAAAATAATYGADAKQVMWDAWRRDDGRWLVRFAWDAEDGSALFSFDPSGRSVQPEDDPARIVAGVAPIEPQESPDDAPEPEVTAGPARLSVVESLADEPADDEPAALPVAELDTPGPPVRGLVRPADPAPADDDEHEHEHEHTAPITAASRRSRRNQRGRPERRRREPELWADEPAADDGADDATSERLHLSDIAAHVETEEQPDLAPTADTPTPPAQRKPAGSSSRSRRPSVPSWDEIMFGRRKND